MPEHVSSDLGASITSTVRAQRITELIQLAIEKGHKLDYKDVMEIQNDTVDMMARDMVPHIMKLASAMLEELTPMQREDAQEAIKQLSHWHGQMHETSVGATIFSAWRNFFFDSLFNDQINNDDLRLKMAGNYPFTDFVQRMILTLGKEPENKRFNRVCAHGYKEYKGNKHCIYNIVRALADGYDFLR